MLSVSSSTAAVLLCADTCTPLRQGKGVSFWDFKVASAICLNEMPLVAVACRILMVLLRAPCYHIVIGAWQYQ